MMLYWNDVPIGRKMFCIYEKMPYLYSINIYTFIKSNRNKLNCCDLDTVYDLFLIFHLQKSGLGMLFSFNPITGTPLTNIPTDGMELKYNVLQAFMVGEMDENFLKGIVMMDNEKQVTIVIHVQ